MLMTGGPDAIGMRRLAAAVGITHGNLQYYFPTRRDLLVVLFDQEVDKYTSGVRVAVARARTRKSRIHALLDSGLALIRTPEIVLWRQMVGMVDQNPEIAALHAQELAAYEGALTDELRRIEPRLSARRARHVAKLIQAIVDGLSLQYAHVDPEDPDILAMEAEAKAAILGLLDSAG
jgi:AcrR family transcriptional regulator